ncbi:hypothetical protein [Leptothoe spongobia]|uniref:hypothetical protein n=1 Tax=Leptothoe spongobia TaxID=2651728 RepID=UPI001C0280AE|nr:hypothetical protein [Leptothoe spongobia]
MASPYIHPDAYATVLNRYTASVDNPRLKAANAYRQVLDLTGTPLLYTLFATLPKHYGRALASYQCLQILMFVTAIVLIGILKGQPHGFWPLALVLSATFVPFTVDLGVANLNAIQLFLVTISTLLVDRATGGIPRERTKSGVIVLCLFIFIVLLKPSLLLPILFLGLAFGLKYGIPKLTVLVPVGMAFIALIVASTSIFLGSSRVWLDWYETLSSSKDRLTYPIEAGNFSTTWLLSSVSQIDISAAVLGIFSLLAISLGGAVILPALRKKIAIHQSIHVMAEIIKNTGLVVSLALTATLALSPLVWSHYYTLLLFPILWLFDFGRWSAKNIVGLLSLIFSGGILLKIIAVVWLPSPELRSLNFCIGCLLVWVGLLLAVVEMANKRLGKLVLSAE